MHECWEENGDKVSCQKSYTFSVRKEGGTKGRMHCTRLLDLLHDELWKRVQTINELCMCGLLKILQNLCKCKGPQKSNRLKAFLSPQIPKMWAKESCWRGGRVRGVVKARMGL